MQLFKKKKEVFRSPMEGRLIALEKVDDQVFSGKMIGDGFAVEITNAKVVAPVSGEIIVAFETGHAYGIKTRDGKEILLHIGIDTVELQGKGFHPKVKMNDTVKQGDILVEVDLEYVKKSGKSLQSPVIFTSGEGISIVKEDKDVTHLEDDIIVINEVSS